jgi:hypothetical protein
MESEQLTLLDTSIQHRPKAGWSCDFKNFFTMLLICSIVLIIGVGTMFSALFLSLFYLFLFSSKERFQFNYRVKLNFEDLNNPNLKPKTFSYQWVFFNFFLNYFKREF